jgi:hypothetical protein
MKITKYTETCEIKAPSYIVVKFISGDCYTIQFTESENKKIGRIYGAIYYNNYKVSREYEDPLKVRACLLSLLETPSQLLFIFDFSF